MFYLSETVDFRGSAVPENIKFDKFSELTDTFRKNGIPTYTELIMGMPGETLESWKAGLEILATDTKVGSIYIYNCGVFPNAPMNETAYKGFHKIKTIRSPIYLAHSSKNERGMPEYEDIVVSTSSFSTSISIEGNIPSNIFDESSKLKGASLIFISDLSLKDISGSI